MYANNWAGNHGCPFCRTPEFTSDNERVERLKKRAEANDANAIYELGHCYRVGEVDLPQDSAKAMELWLRAGKLGWWWWCGVS